MIYFSKSEFPNNLSQQQFEIALRKYAIKQNSSLDFNFTTINEGTEKIFHGLETKKAMKFTRIKTSFEIFLPQLIINLSKDQDEKEYKIRMGAVPTAIFGLLIFGTFIGLISLLQGKTSVENVSPILMILIFFITLIMLEFRFTSSRIKKAINKSLASE